MDRYSYAFLYDDFLSDRQYERQVAEIESHLASLDLVGRASRLALFRSARDLVESMVHQGMATIVVIGNDHTLDKVMWFLPDLDVTLGYLPVAEPSKVADMLGIPRGIEACDVLAARLIETLDVGKLDDRYFLTEVSLPKTVAAVDIEGNYRVSPIGGGSITVRNLGSSIMKGIPAADARDGLLEVLVVPHEEPSSRWGRKQRSKETRVLITHGEIISPEPVDAFADNHVMNGMRFTLDIAPKKLRVITGRNRRLAPCDPGLPRSPGIATLPTTSQK